MRLSVFFAVVLVSAACSVKEKGKSGTLFHFADDTGINFRNDLSYTEEFNPYTYRNFYNGAGVAIGDINNDGLDDVFFAGNQTSNRLYLNQGELKFKDITTESGLFSNDVWCTGVSMADVNADGWLDIYVCKSGAPGVNGVRHNELFINNKDLTFTERSKEYNLDVTGLSTHASFFDYDRDGDLDVYIISNSLRSIGGFDLIKDQRMVRDTSGQGTRLMRNDRGTFIDVTEKAGIYSSKIGFALGVTVGDVNGDYWPDIFVSNDFFERDYLYINQKNGSFREEAEHWFKSLSLGSMGADMADVNNDLQPDIIVTEMLPARVDRYKTKAVFDTWDKQQLAVNSGYGYQFPRNMFHLNTGSGSFAEVGRYAGMEATDWSWGALVNDFDGNGYNDIFVANGIGKDLLDLDYVNFMANPQKVREMLQQKGKAIREMVDMIPSEALNNYIFANSGSLAMADSSAKWLGERPAFSNGAAYGDLDNDGDPDLIISNINDEAFVMKNMAHEQGRKFLRVSLRGSTENPFAVGSKVILYAGGKPQMKELIPARGFMSSVSYTMTFGLGNQNADSIVVVWPDEYVTTTRLAGTSAGETIRINYSGDGLIKMSPSSGKPIFTSVKGPFVHRESGFSDFDRDRLLFHMVSNEGPKICVGDVNNDGLEDFYIGGARGQQGSLFVQLINGKFSDTRQQAFQSNIGSEDCGCAFVDVDSDGDQDLYVASGGNELTKNSTELIDRLYINQGKGAMVKREVLLPTPAFENSAVVKPADFDDDGDSDLFVGIRSKPGEYGRLASSYILENDGRGNLAENTLNVCPGLREVGMVTDATWSDLDRDGDDDLIVVGEWMSPRVFVNEKGKLVEQSSSWQTDKLAGWWNVIHPVDMDGDGDVDFVLGNHGLNSRMKASVREPLRMYVQDFDDNGTIEQVIARWWDGKEYPLAQRSDLISQIPEIKKRFVKYESYKNATMEDVFGAAKLKSSTILSATEFRSGILLNQGARFDFVPLPEEAQLFPIYAVSSDDVNSDGVLDLLVGGNQFKVKPEVGRYDAGNGLLLQGSTGGLKALAPNGSGIYLPGEIRDIKKIRVNKNNWFLVTLNNDTVQWLVKN